MAIKAYMERNKKNKNLSYSEKKEDEETAKKNKKSKKKEQIESDDDEEEVDDYIDNKFFKHKILAV